MSRPGRWWMMAIGAAIAGALFALLALTVPAGAQSSGARGHAASPPWTLYTYRRWPPGSGFEFIREPDGFLSLDVSGFNSLNDCATAFYDLPRRREEGKIESGRCVPAIGQGIDLPLHHE